MYQNPAAFLYYYLRHSSESLFLGILIFFFSFFIFSPFVFLSSFSALENAPTCYGAPRWSDPEFPQKDTEKIPPGPKFWNPKQIPRKYRKDTKMVILISLGSFLRYFRGINYNFGGEIRESRISGGRVFFRHFPWKFRVGPARGSMAGRGVLKDSLAKASLEGGGRGLLSWVMPCWHMSYYDMLANGIGLDCTMLIAFSDLCSLGSWPLLTLTLTLSHSLGVKFPGPFLAGNCAEKPILWVPI